MAPEITSANMAAPLVDNKGLFQGKLIYQASGTFDTAPIIWSIADADRDLFEIDKDSGAVTVKSIFKPDYESNTDGYEIKITATSGSLTDSQTITIPIMDIDDFPTRLEVKKLVSQIEENIDTRLSSVKVADIILSDDALGVNHLFLAGHNKDKFELRSDGLYLATGASINFEERGGSTLIISVGLAATGQRSLEFAVPQQISVRVINVDEPGTLSDWTSFPVVWGGVNCPEIRRSRWANNKYLPSMAVPASGGRVDRYYGRHRG